MGNLPTWLGGLFVAGLLFLLVDCSGGHTETRQGQVVDRRFVPGHYTYSTDSKGRTTSDWQPDDYTLIIRTWDGLQKVDTNMEGYYAVHEHQVVTFKVRVGCITHVDWLASYRPQ